MGDTPWHPGMSLGASVWVLEEPGIHPFHEGTAGPCRKWALLALLSPLVQHEAATGTRQ